MASRSLPLKTERLTVLVSPEEKATLHARAEALGISTGEMIRRAALAYRPSDQAAESEIVLEALADELIAAAKRPYVPYGRCRVSAFEQVLEGIKQVLLVSEGIKRLSEGVKDSLPRYARLTGGLPASRVW